MSSWFFFSRCVFDRLIMFSFIVSSSLSPLCLLIFLFVFFATSPSGYSSFNLFLFVSFCLLFVSSYVCLLSLFTFQITSFPAVVSSSPHLFLISMFSCLLFDFYHLNFLSFHFLIFFPCLLLVPFSSLVWSFHFLTLSHLLVFSLNFFMSPFFMSPHVLFSLFLLFSSSHLIFHSSVFRFFISLLISLFTLLTSYVLVLSPCLLILSFTFLVSLFCCLFFLSLCPLHLLVYLPWFIVFLFHLFPSACLLTKVFFSPYLLTSLFSLYFLYSLVLSMSPYCRLYSPCLLISFSLLVSSTFASFSSGLPS